MNESVEISKNRGGVGSFFTVLTESVLRDLGYQTFSRALLLLEGLKKMVLLVFAVPVLRVLVNFLLLNGLQRDFGGRVQRTSKGKKILRGDFVSTFTLGLFFLGAGLKQLGRRVR